MASPQIAPFGSWKSPITADAILAGGIGLGAVAIDGDDLYWSESRPTEKGRNVLVKRDRNGTTEDLTPATFNVRTRVHEYGGGSFLIEKGTTYFVNFIDQRIYAQSLNSDPKALTLESQKRYADFILDASRNRLITVCEDHSSDSPEPENFLASINLETGEIKPLVSGNDFYSSPRLSPNQSQLSWITWEHPNLPWDSTQLWLAEINATGELENIRCIAGESQIESISEPKWSPDGMLYFSSDRDNWWNLYRYHQGNIESIYPMEAEFAYPHWVFGLSTYTFVNAEKIICTYTQNGRWYLAKIDLKKLLLIIF